MDFRKIMVIGVIALCFTYIIGYSIQSLDALDGKCRKCHTEYHITHTLGNSNGGKTFCYVCENGHICFSKIENN